MESLEVLMVEGQNGPALCRSKSQNCSVRNALSSLPGLLYRQYVMPDLPQDHHDAVVEVLVGIKFFHRIIDTAHCLLDATA